ncbi:MAG: 30S ribosomal protein S7 [Candidatus Blackburnbacteria bacterium]|nr:30S ribosomal protein S7 [Candidatus Blackburnbacteria bacterium]
MRKAKAVKHQVVEDPVYKHRLVTKLINRSMYDGKRSVAQKQVYRAFEIVKSETNEDPLHVFLQAMENIKPNTEVRPRRIGGAAYQVPAPVRGVRRESLGIRWLIQAASTRPSSQYKTYAAKLAGEIISARKGEGGAITKKQEVERVAESNRAFAHFKW